MTFSRSGKSVVVGVVAVSIVLATAGCSTKPQRFYRRAEAFFAQGQYELAAREYARIVQQWPRDPLADDALYKLAYLYREELDNPSGALKYYRRLADEYAKSNYVDDALLWIVYLQRQHVRKPEMCALTCQEIAERFPDDQDLRGRAHLEVAGAYMDAGRLTEAGERCAQISAQFSGRPNIAGEALLMLANITRKTADDPQESLKLYERVVDEYPDTRAAVSARQILGLAYYDEKTEADKARLAEQHKQARVLRDVPPIEEYPGEPAMELLSAMTSMLRKEGVSVSLDEVVVISGLPFTFSFALDRPASVQAFYRNPAAAVAQQMGFGYNLWTSAGGANVLETATGCLMKDHPLLITYGRADARWCLITGHRPAEKELYLLRPGAGHAVKLSPEEFVRVWQASKVPALWPQGGVSGLQFAVTERQAQPDLAATIRSVVVQASLAWDQTELMKQPAGAAAHRALLDALTQAAQAEDPALREQIKAWAGRAIPLVIRTRQAAARFFADPGQELPQPDRAALVVAGTRYEQIAERWEGLAQLIAQAAVQAGEEAIELLPEDRVNAWHQAVETAQEIADLEGESLDWLASSLSE